MHITSFALIAALIAAGTSSVIAATPAKEEKTQTAQEPSKQTASQAEPAQSEEEVVN